MARAGWRCGLVASTTNRPLDAARAALTHGVGVRSVHALHAATVPDRVAMVDDRRSLSYRDADDEIRALATGLRDHVGASRHRPVLVMLENRVEYLTTWFALFRLGITCAHLSRYATLEEIEPLVERSGGRIAVGSATTAPLLRALAQARPDLHLTVVNVDGDGPNDYRRLVARGHRNRESRLLPGPTSDNVVYTSGTTGRPKGAVRNFAALGVAELLSILDRLPLHVGDQHLVVAPLYHSGAQAFVLLNAALAATLHLQESFEAHETLRRMSDDQINSVFMVPSMTRRILDLPAAAHRAHPTDSLRALISGAAPFDEALRLRAIERFGAGAVFDFYGATELGWVTLVDGTEMIERPGTLGRAIPGQEIAIMDAGGRALPPREVGRVYTRSAQVMSGYLSDADATERSRRGPWLTVDDLGYLDDAGHLFVTGRDRDMVISGGVNVYPVEVENALAHHPGIDELSVIGLPDDQWGECLTAVYVGPETLPPDDVRAWASERLSPYKIPRRWERVEALPRNPTGKVLKRVLIERYGTPR